MKAIVVVPTYNEKDNLRPLIEQILALPAGFEIVVADDNSPDGTGQLADAMAATQPRIHVLHRAAKEGIGPAYIDGFKYALAQGATHICQMDADLSHDPEDLPRLLAATETCDVAVGSRYHGGVRVLDWSVRRLALSLGASWYVRLILRMPIDDPTGGFKCWRRQVLEGLDLDHIASRGYSFQIEMSYRAWRRGFHLQEVPITFRERIRGGSKITKNIIYEALYVLWRIRYQARRDRQLPRPAAIDSSVKGSP